MRRALSLAFVLAAIGFLLPASPAPAGPVTLPPGLPVPVIPDVPSLDLTPPPVVTSALEELVPVPPVALLPVPVPVPLLHIPPPRAAPPPGFTEDDHLAALCAARAVFCDPRIWAAYGSPSPLP